MVVLVGDKNVEDLIKTTGARMLTTIKCQFSDIHGHLTSSPLS